MEGFWVPKRLLSDFVDFGEFLNVMRCRRSWKGFVEVSARVPEGFRILGFGFQLLL